MSPRHDLTSSPFVSLVKPEGSASFAHSNNLPIKQTSIQCDTRRLHSCSIGKVILAPLHRFHITKHFDSTLQGLLQYVEQAKIQTIVIADTAPTDIAKKLVVGLTQSSASVFYVDHHADLDLDREDPRYTPIQQVLGRNCITATRDEAPSTAELLGFGSLSPDNPTLYLFYPPDFDAIVSGLYACGLDPVHLNLEGESLQSLDVLARVDSPKSKKVRELPSHIREEDLPTWALGLLSISNNLSHDVRCAQIMTALAQAIAGGSNSKEAKKRLHAFEADERKRLQAAQLLFKRCVDVYPSERIFKISIQGKQLNDKGYGKIESYNPALVPYAKQLLTQNTGFDSYTLYSLLWQGMTPVDNKNILADGCIIAEHIRGDRYLISARGRLSGLLEHIAPLAGRDAGCVPKRNNINGFTIQASKIEAFLSALDTRLQTVLLDQEVSRSRGWDPDSRKRR